MTKNWFYKDLFTYKNCLRAYIIIKKTYKRITTRCHIITKFPKTRHMIIIFPKHMKLMFFYRALGFITALNIWNRRFEQRLCSSSGKQECKYMKKPHNYIFGFFIYLHSCFPEDEQSLCSKRHFQIFNAVINPKALWTFWIATEA